MILDFKEIPQANVANGEQDEFELFAREFLSYMNYSIVEDPSRGADGGKDLVVEEYLKLKGEAEHTIRWLVSCKHFAHRGVSVTENDEPNILERVTQHKCDGFMGFYSTLPSSALNTRLHSIVKTNIFDKEKIERYIVNTENNPEALSLFVRFFPKSWEKYLSLTQQPKVAPLFHPDITCNICGKDLFEDPKNSIYVLVRDSNDKIIDVKYLTKGYCDNISSKQLRDAGYTDYWGEFWDLLNPHTWLYEARRFAEKVQQGKFSQKGFEKMLHLLVQTYSQVARQPSAQENERYNTLKEFDLL